jgi:hypothetical protein
MASCLVAGGDRHGQRFPHSRRMMIPKLKPACILGASDTSSSTTEFEEYDIQHVLPLAMHSFSKGWMTS